MSDANTTAIENVPAISANGLVTLAGKTFKVREQVTKRVLQQKDGVPNYVKFLGPATVSSIQVAPAGRSAVAKMAPARVAEICNLETGELMLYIMNRVLESELERFTGGDYVPNKDTGIPDPELLKAGYVGREFAIVSEAPGANGATDRRYRTYRILELESDDEGVHKAPGATVIEGDTPVAVDRGKRKG